MVIPSVARAVSPRRPYRPTIAASDAHAVDGARPSSGPQSQRSAQVSAWQRWSDRSHELELAAALEDGGGTGKDRGGDLVVRGPAVNIREVLGGGLAFARRRGRDNGGGDDS
jgi:hypothetical protein